MDIYRNGCRVKLTLEFVDLLGLVVEESFRVCDRIVGVRKGRRCSRNAARACARAWGGPRGQLPSLVSCKES